MKAKTFAVAILMISIIMIISGTVCAFVVSLKEDREATQARMLVVNDEYEGFNNSVTSFEEAREALYNQYLGNVFYDTLANDEPMLKEKVKVSDLDYLRKLAGIEESKEGTSKKGKNAIKDEKPQRRDIFQIGFLNRPKREVILNENKLKKMYNNNKE